MATFVPELLSPAGSLEKMKLAVLYGADAAYLSGQNFGLRAASENLTLAELKEGLDFAHQRDSKVYVTMNAFLHDSDFEGLPSFLRYLEQIKVDALIVSDLGVIKTVRKHTQIPVHLSTQSSCISSWGARFWKDQGISRIVLGREVALDEAKRIKEKADIEIEMFIHGSMCMSYSGHCTISNFTQGRDSNRGGCAQSCRFEYDISFSDQKKVQSFFMSSKDLNGIELIKNYASCGIDSIKIEGRMKGPLYAATATKAYRLALDWLKEEGDVSKDKLVYLSDELKKISHRDYTLASLLGPAGFDSIYSERENEVADYESIGQVIAVVPGEFIYLEVRGSFFQGEELEVIPFHSRPIPLRAELLENAKGESIAKANPGRLVRTGYVEGVEEYNIVRKKSSSAIPNKREEQCWT